jgi:hypothetical protein
VHIIPLDFITKELISRKVLLAAFFIHVDPFHIFLVFCISGIIFFVVSNSADLG